MKRTATALVLFLYASVSFAMAASERGVMQASQSWARAVNTHNVQKIISLYDSHAYFYPTFQNMITNRQGVTDYFKKLATHQNLKVRFIQEHIRLYGNAAVNSGLYDFSYDENGKHINIPARYTFVYASTPKGWLIVDHHSSVLPEQQKTVK